MAADARSLATVTFVFTDVERSTELLRVAGSAYPALLTRHDELLGAAVAANGGTVETKAGDGWFVTFPSPSSALSACVQAQLALTAEPWPPPGLRVRMGIHTGEVAVENGRMIGLAIHEAARVGGAAHGGQIVLSSAARGLIGEALPGGVDVLDLGPQRFKGLGAPMQVFQVCHPALPDAFAPLATTSARAMLPRQITGFVGRVEATAAVAALCADHRLVTLVGPGGVGKTRLAIEAARALGADHRDGTAFVDLAAVTDPSLVPTAIAAALGIQLRPDRPPLPELVAAVAPMALLLVLDNCEHVLATARPVVASLTASVEHLNLLTTSREVLGVAGEITWNVPALDPETDGAALFRLRAHDAGASLDDTDDAAIADLCRQLDGLPLAIELGVAQLRTATLRELAARVDQVLLEPADGERHSSLTSMLAWTHDRLGDDERVLLRRLAVFSGPITLESAEAVGGFAPLTGVPIDRLLVRLTSASMLQRKVVDGSSRFELLQVVRAYAAERLDEAGERAETVARHRRHFTARAGIDVRRPFPTEVSDWFTEDELARSRTYWHRWRTVTNVLVGLVLAQCVAGTAIAVTIDDDRVALVAVGAALVVLLGLEIAVGEVLLRRLSTQLGRQARRFRPATMAVGVLLVATAPILVGATWHAAPFAFKDRRLDALSNLATWLALVANVGFKLPRRASRPVDGHAPAAAALAEDRSTLARVGLRTTRERVVRPAPGYDQERFGVVLDAGEADIAGTSGAAKVAGSTRRWEILHAAGHVVLGHERSVRTATTRTLVAFAVVLAPVAYVTDRHGTVPTVLVGLSIFPITLLRARLFRRHEREADLFAAAGTRELEGLVASLHDRATSDVDELAADPRTRAFHRQPPIAERIAMVAAWERAQREG